jgi:hypothetical protein
MKRLTYFFAVLVPFLLQGCTSDGNWKNLITKDLSNWVQLNGTATYKIENDAIIGTTVVNSPNSFLCSRENYGDFILEFETWVDPQINSGVQIRSESRSDYQEGRVHGYQVELDPSERAWSGGIYDEARRGWLYSLETNPEGQKAFKKNEWNHFRIEAIGSSIRTWINGIPCADLIDDMTSSGFIALQVHSVGTDASKAGLQVKWKKLKIVTENLDKYKTPYSPVIRQISYLNNTLTDQEVKDGWILLFDGKTTAGWMNAKTKQFPESGWEIKDGSLMVNPANKGQGGGGDIVSKGKYVNFELSVDFRYAPGSNSGIKYFVDTEKNNGEYASIGCEYQILDDKLHPDAKEGITGNRTLAGLYDLIAPKPKRDNGPDKWNTATIIVKGNLVRHLLNGAITVEYERGNQAWKDLVATSKFKKIPGFGENAEGRILLQDHGNVVAFKNIKIREIK